MWGGLGDGAWLGGVCGRRDKGRVLYPCYTAPITVMDYVNCTDHSMYKWFTRFEVGPQVYTVGYMHRLQQRSFLMSS